MLEASAGDIEFKAGRFTIAGTDRSIGVMELAQRLRRPDAAGRHAELARCDHVTEPVPGAFPNGVHIAEVEIDPDTGHAHW